MKNNKEKGRIGLSMAINYFTLQGYTISLPLNDTQWYDMIIEKDGLFQTVQCKCTGTDNGEVALKSMGGTKGTVYDSVLNHSELDYLFCVDKELNMFLIPLKEIIEAGNTKSIRLKTTPTVNHQGFQTYKYLVRF